MIEAVERTSYVLGEPWVFLVLVVCLGLLAIVHNVFPSRIPNVIKSSFNERITRQIMREEMVFSHRGSWLLLGMSAAVFALICSLAQQSLGMDVGPSAFFIVLLAVCLWVLLRQVIRMLLSALIKQDLGLKEFNYVSASVYKLIGMALLPLAVLMAFLPRAVASYGVYVAGAVLLLSAIFRLLRGWRIGQHYIGRSYYLIFYLCALELIPTLVVIRAMISNIEFP